MNPSENHPNVSTRQAIFEYFQTSLTDPKKRENQVLDCPGGYILQEVRPDPVNPNEKTYHPFAKLAYDITLWRWTVYWHRASTKWNSLGTFRDLNAALAFIKSNPNGCFFG